MAITVYDGAGGPAAPTGGVLRRIVAKMIAAREQEARRRVNAYLLGRDDAGAATVASDRRSQDHAGRGAFPL